MWEEVSPIVNALIAARHDHDESSIPDGSHVSLEPIDGILYAHIILMGAAFGVLYPTGLVLGLTKHRFHVPVQTVASAMVLAGYFLGHAHKGRQFESSNIHARFSPYLLFTLIAQIACGVILKLHLTKGFLGRVRQVIVKGHWIVAILLPIMSWIQIVFGVITLSGFCHADHLGQCLAHEIMGSSFVAYAFVLTLMTFFGDKFLSKANRSQEFYDSSVIMLWGIVNTFTEHKWGEAWSHSSLQHTSMGVIWWAAGMLGIYLSWDRKHNRPARNHIPALVMIFTGYAMSQHHQKLEVSTQVHFMFGVALMASGLVRIIEISFVLKDAPNDSDNLKAWQFLTPLLLTMSGIFFMGATEEQMQVLHDNMIGHSSYLMILASVALILNLLILYLSNLYMQLKPDRTKGMTPIPEEDVASGLHDIELEDFSGDEDAVEMEQRR